MKQIFLVRNRMNIFCHFVLLFNKLFLHQQIMFAQYWPTIRWKVYYKWLWVGFSTTLNKHYNYVCYVFITQIAHVFLLFNKLLSQSTNDVCPTLAQHQQESLIWMIVTWHCYGIGLPTKQPTTKVPRLAQYCVKVCLVCG